VASPHLMAEPVLAHVLPDILDWVQLWGVGRQGQQYDIVWQRQSRRGVPTGLVQDQHSDGTGPDAVTESSEMLIHGVNANGRHNNRCTGLALGADGTEHIR